jgi:hypothetical protein
MKTWSKPTAGNITSSPGGASILNDLADIAIAAPVAGQVLKYDGSQFVNAANNIDASQITTGIINLARLPNLAEISLTGDALPPYIASISPITPSGTQTIEILGEYFSPITQLSIPGVVVESLEVRSPNKIIANISKSGLNGNPQILLWNGTASNQLWLDGIKSVIFADPYRSMVVLNVSRSLVDSSPINKIITKFGDVAISSEQAKYTNNSIKITRGLNNYLSVPASNDFIFPADFTVEAWMRWDGVETAGGAVLLSTGSVGSLDQFGIFSGGVLGYGTISTPIPGITPNNWHHIAISRSNGIAKGFLNGIEKYSISNTATIGRLSTLFIGRRSDNHPWGGYIDSLRITKGIGRYSVNFNIETDIETDTYLSA